MSLIALFNQPWDQIDVAVVDVETTGVARHDSAVQVGIARFSAGKFVGSGSQLVNPGRPIPAEATAIHGITDEMVAGMPTLEEVFALEGTKALLANAQPLAFNAPYDRFKVPAFTDPAEWPWYDPLVIVRDVDRFSKGVGRHKLKASCERHGVWLDKEHDAQADAIAAGKLFYVVAEKWVARFGNRLTVGEFLEEQRKSEAHQWFLFFEWMSKQPPREQQGAA